MAKQQNEPNGRLIQLSGKGRTIGPTVRDICEAVAALAKEPEGVTYAEVDAGGVPALWCIPQGSDVEGTRAPNPLSGRDFQI